MVKVIVDGKLRCSGCKRDLSVALFTPAKKVGCGYTSRCRECLRNQRRCAYQSDPEVRRKAIAAVRRWQQRNPERVVAMVLRYRRLRRATSPVV